jgi:exodeoxyribonuclease VII large subunit
MKVETYRTGLDNVLSRLVYRRPLDGVNMRRQDVDSLLSRAGRAIVSRLTVMQHRLESAANRLAALDPTAILSRGYSLAFQAETGRLITRVAQAPEGTKVDLRVSDGTIKLKVDEETKGQ